MAATLGLSACAGEPNGLPPNVTVANYATDASNASSMSCAEVEMRTPAGGLRTQENALCKDLNALAQ